MRSTYERTRRVPPPQKEVDTRIIPSVEVASMDKPGESGRREAIYFDGETLRRIDAHQHELQEREPGVRVTRSGAVRNLVLRGLGHGEPSGDGGAQ